MTQMPQYRELRRSRSDRMIGGVCGGVARYLNVDPVAIRVATAVLTVITGGGLLLAYLIAWILIPEEPGPTWSPPGSEPQHPAYHPPGPPPGDDPQRPPVD